MTQATERESGITRETLLAWKAGSAEAFERIVTLTMRRAYATAVGLLGNEEDARDISQEAFMAAHRARERFDPERPFYPWFYRILRNRCLNCIEKRRRRDEISMDALAERPDDEPSPEARLLRKERSERIWRALFVLSPDHREIIVLRSFQELTYREIAQTLGISEGTVMSRLYYARRALAAALRREPNGRSAEGDDHA